MKQLLLTALTALLALAPQLATSAPRGKEFQRIVTVVLENTSYEDAIAMPFLSTLVAKGTLFTNFHAETHPSQANYIAMVAGTTKGVPGGRNIDLNFSHIGDLLEAAGYDWRVYAEGWPGNCFLGWSEGAYYRKHNPFISFTNVQRNPARCAKIVRGADFFTDAAKGNLPAYSFYVPDINNDGHDTGSAFADQWLEKQFGAYLNDPALMEGTLFVVTFDENDDFTDFDNKIFTVFYGPMVQRGISVNERLDHYSLLRMVEENWNLGSLGRGDAGAIQVSGVWAR